MERGGQTRDSGVKQPLQVFGTTEQAAEKHGDSFLQGLKPIRFRCVTQGAEEKALKNKDLTSSPP
jgi:hypothetical protein